MCITRYTEISMYVLLCVAIRNMEIPTCLAKFPCTLPCVSLQGTWGIRDFCCHIQVQCSTENTECEM